MKYPFPIFEYPPIIQDSLTIFVYKTVSNTPISLKDVNSEKIIGEKFAYIRFYSYLCNIKINQLKHYSNMKVYIITYSWSNEMGGHDDGVYDVFLDLAQATKKFNELVEREGRQFKEDISTGVEVQETIQTHEDGSRYVYYGNEFDEFYSASLYVTEPK